MKIRSEQARAWGARDPQTRPRETRRHPLHEGRRREAGSSPAFREFATPGVLFGLEIFLKECEETDISPGKHYVSPE